MKDASCCELRAGLAGWWSIGEKGSERTLKGRAGLGFFPAAGWLEK